MTNRKRKKEVENFYQELIDELSTYYLRDNYFIALLYKDYADKHSIKDKTTEDYVNKILDDLAQQKESAIESLLKKVEDMNLTDEERIDCTKIFFDTCFDGTLGSYFLPHLTTLLLDIHPEDKVYCYGIESIFFVIEASKKTNSEINFETRFGDDNVYTTLMLKFCETNYKHLDTKVFKNPIVSDYNKGMVLPTFGYRYNKRFHLPYTLEPYNEKNTTDWVFILRAINKLPENGKLVVAGHSGLLFRSNDSNIREDLIKKGFIEGILELPPRSITGISYSPIILIFSKNNKSIKYCTFSSYGENYNNRKSYNEEDAEDIYKIYTNCTKTFKYEEIKTVGFDLSYAALEGSKTNDSIQDGIELSKVCNIFRGSGLTSTNFEKDFTSEETGYKILTPGDIEDGAINYKRLRNIQSGEDYKKYILQKGDLVLTSKSSIIKIAVYLEDTKDKIIVTGGMLILRPESEKIDSTYLKLFLESSIGKKLLDSCKKGTVVVSLSPSSLLSLNIPYPSLEEQKLLSNKYNELLSIYDGMKKETEKIHEKVINFYDDALKKEYRC